MTEHQAWAWAEAHECEISVRKRSMTLATEIDGWYHSFISSLPDPHMRLIDCVTQAITWEVERTEPTA